MTNVQLYFAMGVPTFSILISDQARAEPDQSAIHQLGESDELVGESFGLSNVHDRERH